MIPGPSNYDVASLKKKFIKKYNNRSNRTMTRRKTIDMCSLIDSICYVYHIDESRKRRRYWHITQIQHTSHNHALYNHRKSITARRRRAYSTRTQPSSYSPSWFSLLRCLRRHSRLRYTVFSVGGQLRTL